MKIVHIVNESKKDFVDMFDGETYTVETGGELAVPEAVAVHFLGNPNLTDEIAIEAEKERVRMRRGEVSSKIYVREWLPEEEAEAQADVEEVPVVKATKAKPRSSAVRFPKKIS